MTDPKQPDQKTDDPTRCSLPHCGLSANGHDWILIEIASGPQRGEWARRGYCSQYHAWISSSWLGGPHSVALPHKLVLESDPQDNEEDRPWLHPAMRDHSHVPGWPDGMQRKDESGGGGGEEKRA